MIGTILSKIIPIRSLNRIKERICSFLGSIGDQTLRKTNNFLSFLTDKLPGCPVQLVSDEFPRNPS